MLLLLLWVNLWPQCVHLYSFTGHLLPAKHTLKLLHTCRLASDKAGIAQEKNDYVDILQTLVDAEDEGPDKLRDTFRRLARTMHPDVVGESEEATERFRGLLTAYRMVEQGNGRTTLAEAQEGRGPPWGQTTSSASDASSSILRSTTNYDGRRRDKCLPGDVVLFRFQDQDLQKFELKGRCKWGLSVVICDDGGFIHGQRLVFEDEDDTAGRYRSGWLVTDEYEEMILIDPMAEVEVVSAYTSSDERRYRVLRPVDTEYVYTQWWGW